MNSVVDLEVALKKLHQLQQEDVILPRYYRTQPIA